MGGRGLAPADDPRLMGFSLAALFAAGAVIGAVSLLLPHPSSFDVGGLWSNIAVAAAGAAAIFATTGRLPVWAYQVLIATGTLVITRAIYLSDEPNGFYAAFYYWVGLYSFFFFGRLWGFVQLAILGASFAWVLNETSHTAPAGRWAMTMGTIVVSGLLVAEMASRMRRHENEATSRARALQAVDAVAHGLARSTTAEAAAEGICTATRHAARAAGSSLWQPTADGGALEATAATDPGLAGRKVLFVGQGSGAIRAFTSGEPFFVAEAPGDPLVDQGLVEWLGAVSVYFQPVIRDGVPIGVLVAYWTARIEALDHEVGQIVGLLSAEAAVAIERAELLERLERAARTDDLTGLLNRRAWDEYLTREIARARRGSGSLCVAMVDLDRFKDYNDRFGHQAGDRLLKEAAAAWMELVRDTDLLARYGGDEFALALPDCSPEEAAELIGRLRTATPEDQSASAGVVAWDGEESEVDLVARADRALYAAKGGGRDRTVQA